MFGTSIIEPKVEDKLTHNGGVLTNIMLKLVMDNIVGSPIVISKFEARKWSQNKLNLELTKDQFSLIVGSLLGDGTMRIGQGAINANFKVEHGLMQKDLVISKYEILKPWVLTKPKISYRYNIDGSKYEKSWWFRTVRHSKLTEIRKTFYPNGKKIIPQAIDVWLSTPALAWWIMDDGCYSKSKIDISTYSFALAEVERLLKLINHKFSVTGKYFKDRDKGFRMYFNTTETKRLVDLIEPYVIDSMRYKIGYSRTP